MKTSGFVMFKDYFCFEKYSLIKRNTIGDNRNKPIKLGIAIKPLKVSAMPQRRPRSIVAPTIETKEYASINGLFTLEPHKNSKQRVPYKPQPKIVEKAKHTIAIAVNKVTQLP